MKQFLAFIGILMVAGGLIWWIKFQPAGPKFSFASRSVDVAELPSAGEFAKNFDHQLAETIRGISENGIQLPQVAGAQQLNEVGKATVSASVSTTPEELWKALREEGAAAVMGTLAKNANVSVNNVSANMANEARYQYCRGVVETYERDVKSLF